MKRTLTLWLQIIGLLFAANAQPFELQLNCTPDPPQDINQWQATPNVFDIQINGVTQMPRPMVIEFQIKAEGGAVMYSNQTNPFVTQPGPWSMLIPASDVLNGPFPVFSSGFVNSPTGMQFPPGQYTSCVRLLNHQNMEVLAEGCCSFSFAEEEPAEINLLFPSGGETVEIDNLIFQWVSTDYSTGPSSGLQYQLLVWEILAGQTFSEAMEFNPVAYQTLASSETTHLYDEPSGLLNAGSAYVWQIRKTDQLGNPVGDDSGFSVPEVFVLISEALVQTWQETGSTCPGKNGKTDSLPFFSYDPFASTGVNYNLQIYQYNPPTSSSRATYSLFHTIQSLKTPTYAYVLNDPKLNPGMYASQMVAQFGNQTFATLLTPFNVVETQADIDPSDLLDKIDKVRKQIDSLRKALGSNPLVQEQELIELIVGLLSGESTLIDIIKKILNGESIDITDPQTLLDAMDYLEKLLRFLEKYDMGLSDSVKQQLHDLAVKIRYWRMRLRDAIEKGESVAEILNEILDAMKSGSFSGIIDYIQNQITEAIKDKLKEILVKKLGSKAAGALISIISDLINFTDALLQIKTLEELTILYNQLILDYINTYGETTVNDTVWFSGAEWGNCTFTFQPKKVCWKAKAGGKKGEGDWKEHDMKFADGAKSKTKDAADMKGKGGCDPNYHEFNDPVDEDSKSCPQGQGPCVVYMQVTVTNCPKAGTYYIFMGVIKC